MADPKILPPPVVDAGTGAGGKTPAPVAAVGAVNPTPGVVLGTGAKQTVPLFGGNVGGRKRADGLAPGSPDALAADKAKAAERKRLARAAERGSAEPAALPAAVAGAPQASPGAFGGDTGFASPPPGVPWNPADLKNLCDALIEAADDLRAEDLIKAAREARLPDRLLREMERDAHFPKLSKESLRVALPALMAKWLNKAGISGEHKEEVMVIGCLLAIVAHGKMFKAKVKELIDANKPPAPAPAPAKAEELKP